MRQRFPISTRAGWLREIFVLLAVVSSTACRHHLSLPARPGASSDDPGARKQDAASDDAGQDSQDGGRHDASVDGGKQPTCLDGTCCDASTDDCGRCSATHPCPGDRPICDDADGQCRGCERDAECGANAVCIEDQGKCVADEGVAFVTSWGEDVGTCPRSAPCQSIGFAVKAAGKRKVFHVLGGSLMFNQGTIIDAGTGLVLDGEDTVFSGTPDTMSLEIRGKTDITVEGFRVTAVKAMNQTAIKVSGSAKARFVSMRFEGDGGTALYTDSDAQVTVHNVHVGNLTNVALTEMICVGGKLRVEQSILETSNLQGDGGCVLTVAQNRFESNYDRSVRAQASILVMENNLLIHREGYNDSVGARDMYPGSTIRFNTFVNTTALPSDGLALGCDNTTIVTSNVFAYNSAHPVGGQGCEPRYSVFDDVALDSAGTGNRVAGLETLFVDRAGGDYHLAKDSVARAAAEPGIDMVTTDLEGTARPTPQGTRSDCGAYEAP